MVNDLVICPNHEECKDGCKHREPHIQYLGCPAGICSHSYNLATGECRIATEEEIILWRLSGGTFANVGVGL